MLINIPDEHCPKNCIKCRFLYRNIHTIPEKCILANKKFNLGNIDLRKKPSWCPYNSKSKEK